jgi:mono/diheme cytochrome c family protein
MQHSSKLLSRPKLRGWLLVLGAVYSLAGTAAQAQNIDEGKSATRLFADSCATCHRSPRSLAKGRFRPALFLFLQDHYTSSMGAAWELSAYLASVDTPPSSRSKAKPPPSAARRPHPPKPVPSDRSN